MITQLCKVHSQMLKTLFIFFFSSIILTTSAQNNNSKIVIAQSGDGIYKLLERHGIPSNQINAFISLNKAKLKKGNQLIVGEKYTLPFFTERGRKSEPLFGKKYASTDIKSTILNGAVFYLVSGHGGPDPGATSKLNGHLLCEDEYAYDITLRLGKRLIEEGAKVYFVIQDKKDGIRDHSFLSHDYDEICYPNSAIPRKQNARLRQRAEAVNVLYKKDKSNYKRCIVLHVDARHSKKDIDLFFYHHAKSTNGKSLALSMRNTMDEEYRRNQPNRGYYGTVSSRGLYMINVPVPPVVYIELGNINNKRGQQRIMLENNRQALANWMCKGIIKDYKNK